MSEICGRVTRVWRNETFGERSKLKFGLFDEIFVDAIKIFDNFETVACCWIILLNSRIYSR